MGFGLHVIQFPSGKFGFVGTVPAELLGWRQATTADIMAGRVHLPSGLAHQTLTFDTAAAAVAFAASKGFTARTAAH